MIVYFFVALTDKNVYLVSMFMLGKNPEFLFRYICWMKYMIYSENVDSDHHIKERILCLSAPEKNHLHSGDQMTWDSKHDITHHNTKSQAKSLYIRSRKHKRIHH